MTRITGGTALILLLASAVGAEAQLLPGGSSTLVSGAYFESYEFLDPALAGFERLSLISAPFGARAPLIDRLGLEVSGSFARAEVEYTDGTEVSLSGLTDTEVRLSFDVVPDRVTLSAGILLPTGNSTHSEDEASLAGLIAADLIPFRVSNWGSGGGAGLISTLVVPAGDFAFGVTAGYTIGREFEPAEEEELAYRPGDELRVRVAVERTIGSSAKASLLLGGQVYRDDEFAGTSVFQPGNRFEGMGSFSFAVGAGSAGVVYGGLQHRGSSTLVLEELETPEQTLILTGGGMRIPAGFATFVPSVDLRLFRRDDGVGQGHLTSLGAGLEWPFGQLVAIPALRARFGEVLLWEDAESSVRGVEAGLGVRLSL